MRDAGCVTSVMTEVDRIKDLPSGTTILFPLLGVGSGGGELEPTVNSLLGAALDYFAASTSTRIAGRRPGVEWQMT
jgi:hypothetical protein